jgi:ABC-type molybdate transport system substrate-binding protein
MKNFVVFWVAIAVFATAVYCASAQGMKLFADQAFQPSLQEIVPLFTEQTGFEVELSIGRSSILADRIRSGIPADLFFPASEEVMRHMMSKGLVDVALKRNVLILPGIKNTEEEIKPEPQYIAAAVLTQADHRLQAMALLEFLTSQTAREAFARQGFSLP